MTHLILALILFLVLALAWIFYAKFTRKGAIPLQKALRDFTSWLGFVGIALSSYIVDVLQWFAAMWDPVQAKFGELLSQPSLASFVQLMSFVFLLLKFKGQSALPKFDLPDFPDDTSAPDA